MAVVLGSRALSYAAETDSGGCGTCHSALTAKKYVHTALAGGDCTACHEPSDSAGKCKGAAAGKGWKLSREPEALCFECHDRGAVAGAAAVHSPVARGQCTGCHDPHASDAPNHLVATGSALCLRCHAASRAGTPGAPARLVDLSKNVHPAVDAGECTDCHGPHGAPYAKQLKQPLPALCYGCHDRKDGAPFTHSAVVLGRCTGCHDPHASPQQKLLRDAKASGLCFRCHADDVTGRKHVHVPVAEGECLTCHEPHGGKNAKNLVEALPALCETCHADVTTKKNVHAAIARWGCTACHDPHASANEKQLILAPNALCLRCHPGMKGDHVFTAFDGRPHPLEGKPDPSRAGKALSCVSCHSPHASDGPRLFRRATTKQDVCKDCHGNR